MCTEYASPGGASCRIMEGTPASSDENDWRIRQFSLEPLGYHRVYTKPTALDVATTHN